MNRLAALALVAVLLLAGCGGAGSSPQADSTPEPTAAPTPTPETVVVTEYVNRTVTVTETVVVTEYVNQTVAPTETPALGHVDFTVDRRHEEVAGEWRKYYISLSVDNLSPHDLTNITVTFVIETTNDGAKSYSHTFENDAPRRTTTGFDEVLIGDVQPEIWHNEESTRIEIEYDPR